MIRVIFFGTPKIALNSLEFLYNSKEIDVVGIVTQPDKPVGRGHKIVFPSLKVFGIDNNIPVFQPKSIRKEPEIIKQLKLLKPDFFVTFAFGQILSQEVLDIPNYETINLHASLLPKYRGANPIQRAIINGDTKTGICTMITELGLDSGDICLKLPINITEDMNCVELFNIISEKSPELIEKTLVGLVNKTIIPISQPQDGISQAPKMTKEEAKIDWKKSAKEIHDLIRGIYNMPSAYFYYKDKIIKVLTAKVIENDIKHDVLDDILFKKVTKSGIEVNCGLGTLLIITVKPEGKGEMHASAWANGLR